MIYWHFIRKWLFYLSVFMTGVSVFNYCMDPFDLFATPRVRYLNQTKPSVGNKVRLSKPYRVLQIKPQVLISGNSRPEMAIDPNHNCFAQAGLQAYNLGIPGATVYLQSRYIQHALAAGSVKWVLHALEFSDFLLPVQAPLEQPLPAEMERRLLVNAHGQMNTQRFWQVVADHAQALLSVDALYSSLKTLLLQGKERFSTRTALGFNPADAYFSALVHDEGEWSVFENKLLEIYKRLQRKQRTLYVDETQWSERLESLKRIMDATQRTGARLILYIDPYHAEYLEVIYRAGFGGVFEQWKRTISRIASERQLPLYDFSGYDAYSTELPSRQMQHSTSLLKWFWEPSHYRKELGDRMLPTLLQELCPQSSQVPLPGHRLTPDNVEESIHLLRTKRKIFIFNQPQIIDYLEGLKKQIKASA